ncbi:MAG: biotin--[Clostridia bacterium]|nr:biotin--[acetyl-CoA-carboxylase] ligase [Clostridia bacterium]
MSDKRIFIEKYETVTSTNDVLREKALCGAPEGTVVIANFQTAGRGRMGRNFYSPAGSGIYMSILLRPESEIADNLCITARAAVAAAKAIDKHTDKKAMIKWVNDIYLNDRKVCGILTEGRKDTTNCMQSYMIVGIGINLKEPACGYPNELNGVAGAVFDKDEFYDADKLIKDILFEFFSDNPNLLNDYRYRNMLDKKHIVVSHGNKPKYEAQVTGIDESFGLCICLSDGTETVLRSGEVSVRQVNIDQEEDI